jgi:uncharacterized protein YecE (DUF72 family)
MQVYVGTSGFSYREWKGSFYPRDLPAQEMLRFYATNLPAVEINNTFYRLPKTSALQSWAEQVPDRFRFAIKASRRITHLKRLKGAEEETAYLVRTLEVLGPRLGVILFQLPPNLKKDVGRLREFQELLPESTHAAFEFRHSSWLDAEVMESLRARGSVWCVSDTDDSEGALVDGSSWGYLRLRRSAYAEADLARWVERVRAMDWKETFVFFKHEDGAVGPRLARRFLELAGTG